MLDIFVFLAIYLYIGKKKLKYDRRVENDRGLSRLYD